MVEVPGSLLTEVAIFCSWIFCIHLVKLLMSISTLLAILYFREKLVCTECISLMYVRFNVCISRNYNGEGISSFVKINCMIMIKHLAFYVRSNHRVRCTRVEHGIIQWHRSGESLLFQIQHNKCVTFAR